MDTKNYDIIIIGAGVVGCAVARELSRYKIDVAVLEKEVDASFGVSKANSGIIHAGFHSPPGSLKAEFAVKGNSKFDQLSRELDFPFKRNGELMLAFTEEDLGTISEYYERGIKNGVPGMELLNRDNVLEMEPHLNSDVLGALHAPSAGVLGPYEYCFALMENAMANGVDFIMNSKVINIEQRQRDFLVSIQNNQSYSCSRLVNAAGLFADEIAKMLEIDDFAITPRKGEEYLLDRRVKKLVNRTIFPCPAAKSKGMLVIPTVDGPVMVGPTAVDIYDKEDFSTSSEGLEIVFKQARRMIPEIKHDDAITSFAGLRPVASGNDFIVGKTKIKGFFNAAGIQSPGLTASPIIAEAVVAALIEDGMSSSQNPSFNPLRPRKTQHLRPFIEKRDYGQVQKLFKKNDAYGNIVCRCENVTEAEIVDAVRSGHITLDAVKFATRAGTGRCQAGFCTSRILNIIHRETGLSIEKISKKGKGSEIVGGKLHKVNEKTESRKKCKVRKLPHKTGSETEIDVLVIGAGPAGLAAGVSLKKHGTSKILIVDREPLAGGILRQCIHNGFGIHNFKIELTGPEYAERWIDEAEKNDISILLNSCVVDIINGSSNQKTAVILSPEKGCLKVKCKAVVLAMGCRERNRGNINIPGSRPSGIMTAGMAQKLVNLNGFTPGKNIVILGSGDIGLIMARRLTWEGANVKAVIERNSYPGGLERNITQCLNDFNIPLYLSHSVSKIIGKKRIEAVEISPLNYGEKDLIEKFVIDCDTLLLSIGLLPENELSLKAGVDLDPRTGGPIVDSDLMTNVPGIFAAGNVLHVHDIVDWVSEEAEDCGRYVSEYLTDEKKSNSSVKIKTGNLLRYALPDTVAPGKEALLSLRSIALANNVEMIISTDDGTVLSRKKVQRLLPSIMIRQKIKNIPEKTKYIKVEFQHIN